MVALSARARCWSDSILVCDGGGDGDGGRGRCQLWLVVWGFGVVVVVRVGVVRWQPALHGSCKQTEENLVRLIWGLPGNQYSMTHYHVTNRRDIAAKDRESEVRDLPLVLP